MSDSNGFIEEVNDELRRERMLGALRRYGWIAVLVVLVIVGGAAFSEYRKAQTRAAAQDLGDSIGRALEAEAPQARADALEGIEVSSPTTRAMLDLLIATEFVGAEDTTAAVERLDAVSLNADAPMVYRQIAQFKALTLQGDTLPVVQRRQGYEALAGAGGTLRLLAEEQLALLSLEEGETEDAISRYRALIDDAQVTADLQQRALQVIVALGADPAAPTEEDTGGEAPSATETGE